MDGSGSHHVLDAVALVVPGSAGQSISLDSPTRNRSLDVVSNPLVIAGRAGVLVGKSFVWRICKVAVDRTGRFLQCNHSTSVASGGLCPATV